MPTDKNVNILLYLPGASASFVHVPGCENGDPNEAKCSHTPAQGNAPIWVSN